jgi:hypothetical protein
MVFPEQGPAAASYPHEKLNASADSPLDDFPTPDGAANRYTEAVRRMAAAWTSDTIGTPRSQIAIDPCAAAIGGHGKRGPLGAAAMITLSIFWALVFALFTTTGEEPGAPENKPLSPHR